MRPSRRWGTQIVVVRSDVGCPFPSARSPLIEFLVKQVNWIRSNLLFEGVAMLRR